MTTQLVLTSREGAVLDPESSRFIRTTWILNVRRSLPIRSASAVVRRIDENEALRLEDQTARRNVFSRHSYERDFYLQRIREFADRSVIEIIRPGDPKSVVAEARRIASLIETACLVSTVLYVPRATLLGRLGITSHRKDVLDFTVGPAFRHLSASSKREGEVHGILVDSTFVARFQRLGLEQVISAASGDNPLARRLSQSLSWLQESRLEHAPSAAVVKAAIGYEVLLGTNETEPLRRTLSERAAFLLADDAGVRHKLSQNVKAFYDARSQVVHGGIRKRTKGPSTQQLEAAERILFLLVITLSANAAVMSSENALQEWVEEQKWGAGRELVRPFRPGDLKRALTRAAKPS